MANLKNVLLIVGNGFDLNMGLKTSYKDFLTSFNINDIQNKLVYELLLRHKTNWVDIEQELENCALHGLTNIEQQNVLKPNYNSELSKFEKDDYIQLKISLKSYLKKQEEKEIPNFTTKNSYNLLSKLLRRKDIKLTILNFNYTNTIKRLKRYIYEYYHGIDINNFEHIYVHGNLNDDIVFGIADNAKITKQHNYLLKSYDIENNTTLNISKLLNNSDEILFYGYSLGETDTTYFDDFFKECCVYDDKIEEEMKKKITFYCYKEQGFDELFDRLFTLTEHKMSKLKHLNDCNFINSFE